MNIRNIGVINYSTTTSEAEVAAWAAACEKQMADDVAPTWRLPAPRLQFVPTHGPFPAVDAWMVVADDAQHRYGLGWHDLGPNGEPVGYVLTEYSRGLRQSASRVFSHEVIEMCVDPRAERTVQVGGVLYMVEPGDILSLDQQGYEVDGVLCSGFAHPSYYLLEAGPRYDSGGYLTSPCPTMIHGTMLMYWQGAAWQQRLLAPTPDIAASMEVHESSRRQRRNLGHDRLTRSSLYAR
jgi:hypothetical protein